MSRYSLILLLLCIVNGFQTNPIKSNRQLCQTIIFSIKACVQFAYIDENSLGVSILLGGLNFYTGTVSVTDAKPLCGKTFGASVCLEYNITQLQVGQLNACGKFNGTYPFVGPTITDLGCTIVSNNLV